MLMHTAMPEPRNIAERVVGIISRKFINPYFAGKYLERYREQIELDPERLRYWEAFRAFWLWSRVVDPRVGESVMLEMKQPPGERFDAGLAKRLEAYFWARADAS